MLPIIEFLDKTLGSYGWAILGLTLAVRILVWPLQSASTKSMQRMGKLQPMLKAMQDKYKDQPEVMQKKMAEFYMKNKINPLGGCLPMLVQLPILFALFGTFTGPPFQDKAIPVKVKIVSGKEAEKTTVQQNPTSGADSVFVSKDGKVCKFVVHPGDQTLVLGKAEGQPTADGFNTVEFSVGTSAGEAPADFKPNWRIGQDPNKAIVQPDGKVIFPVDGKITIAAVLPKTADQTEEKSIPVTVTVEPKQGGGGFGFGGDGGEDAVKQKAAASETTAEMTVEGKPVKLAVEPGNLTLLAGKSVQFRVKAVEGTLPVNFHPEWKVVDDPNAATIDENGKAVFKHAGEVIVDAMIPGVAKDEPFYFVSSIGKTAKGMDLLKPENFDVLGLILLFGFTMYLSQKFMVTSPPTDPEQAAVQKQTQQIMPFTITGMFFFMPLPAGVYLYMVFGNILQTFQTWILMQSPVPDLIDVDAPSDDEPAAKQTIDVEPTQKKIEKKKTENQPKQGNKADQQDGKKNDKKGSSGQGENIPLKSPEDITIDKD
jgi:YidC/Oxa1 family membrane protein insertase